MITLLTIFHVIVCIFLILVVLLQQGKGADWAGAFGGGGTRPLSARAARHGPEQSDDSGRDHLHDHVAGADDYDFAARRLVRDS